MLALRVFSIPPLSPLPLRRSASHRPSTILLAIIRPPFTLHAAIRPAEPELPPPGGLEEWLEKILPVPHTNFLTPLSIVVAAMDIVQKAIDITKALNPLNKATKTYTVAAIAVGLILFIRVTVVIDRILKKKEQVEKGKRKTMSCRAEESKAREIDEEQG